MYKLKSSQFLRNASIVLLSAMFLNGCGAVLLGGGAAGVLAAAERRTLSAQAEDKQIAAKAAMAFSENGISSDSNISVTSYNRRVLITGEVTDQATKQKVSQIVKKLENVRGVSNYLEVTSESSFSSRSNDTWITTKVKTALIEDKRVSANLFKIVTERSTVYLMGLVLPQEGEIAAEVASRVSGVLKVVKVYEYVTQSDLERLSPKGTTKTDKATESSFQSTGRTEVKVAIR